MVPVRGFTTGVIVLTGGLWKALSRRKEVPDAPERERGQRNKGPGVQRESRPENFRERSSWTTGLQQASV